jgi:hypothetical protein
MPDGKREALTNNFGGPVPDNEHALTGATRSRT